MMLRKLEALGDRMLGLVVPSTHASAWFCGNCVWRAVCDRTRDWWECADRDTGVRHWVCSTLNPCP